MKQWLYRIYKQNQNRWYVATAANLLFTRCALRSSPPVFSGIPSQRTLRMAIVCDEMSWQDFQGEAELLFVPPVGWKRAIEQFRPHLFFCESAWAGLKETGQVWRGQIYQNSRVRYENRSRLLSILAHCRSNGIPTVFWNKEDPTFFGDEHHNFVGTAMKFDHILTTASECIPRYRALGHSNVHLMPFGVSPRLFGTISGKERKHQAVFAGSWYSDQPQRCRDMEQVFNLVLENDIPLIIYDRQHMSTNPVHSWPARYRPLLRPGIPYAELREIYAESRYGININTVKNSQTMFARRVFELMLCGCVVISNPSKGMEESFPGGIWVAGKPFHQDKEREITEHNRRIVLERHTVDKRMEQMLVDINLHPANREDC